MPAIRIRDVSRSTLDRLKSLLEEAAGTDWSATRLRAAKLRKRLAGRPTLTAPS
jgi:hypothetical protein